MEKGNGVPAFDCACFAPRKTKYCLLIPVINEGARILRELARLQKAGVSALCDVILCDGGSTDGSMQEKRLADLGVNALLIKTGPGKQGAQLRMGLWWALNRGYEGVVTVDGNDKDGVEAVPQFLSKLDEGFDLIQGSRFIRGGRAVRTPPVRYLAVRLIHAPLISLAAGKRFTDTTNAFRGYSRAYLTHPAVRPFREVFGGYELLAYLSVRAPQLGMKSCETPVAREYPARGKTPTKIRGLRANADLLRILFYTLRGKYNPPAGPEADEQEREARETT